MQFQNKFLIGLILAFVLAGCVQEQIPPMSVKQALDRAQELEGKTITLHGAVDYKVLHCEQLTDGELSYNTCTTQIRLAQDYPSTSIVIEPRGDPPWQCIAKQISEDRYDYSNCAMVEGENYSVTGVLNKDKNGNSYLEIASFERLIPK